MILKHCKHVLIMKCLLTWEFGLGLMTTATYSDRGKGGGKFVLVPNLIQYSKTKQFINLEYDYSVMPIHNVFYVAENLGIF